MIGFSIAVAAPAAFDPMTSSTLVEAQPAAERGAGAGRPPRRRLPDLRISHRPLAFLLAAVAAGLAALLRLALSGFFGGGFAYITFYPAVMLTATVCGVGPGVMATAASALLAWLFVLAPTDRFLPLATHEAVSLAVFSTMGVLISVVAGLYHEARRRLDAAEKDLALRGSEERLRLAQEVSRSGAWEWDLRTDENTWSDELWGLYGLPPHSCEPSYEAWRETVDPEDRARVEAAVQEAIREGSELNVEWRSRDGGVPHWLLAHGRPVRDAEGRAARFTGVVLDITERKRAEADRERLLAEVQRRAAELEATFESAPDGLLMFSSTGELLRMNTAARRILGLAGLAAEDAGSPLERRVELSGPQTPDGRPIAPEETVYARALRGEIVRDEIVKLYRPDGETVWLSVSGAPVKVGDELIGAVVIDSDITERKRADEALRRSEALLRAITDGSPDPIFLEDRSSRMLLANPATLSAMGKPAAEVLGKTALEIYAEPAVGRSMVENDRRVMDSGRTEVFEESVPTASGTRVYLSTRSPYRDPDGQVIGVVGVSRDITERTRAEERTRRQNAVLKGIARIFEEALTCETKEDLGRVCLAVAQDVTQSTFGFVGELDADTGLLDAVAIGDRDRDGARTRLEIGGLHGRVLLEGKGFFTNEPGPHADGPARAPGLPPLTSFLGVPLLHGDKVIGMVGLGNRQGGYGPEELEAAEALAPAVIQAFVSQRAEEALRESDRRKGEFLAMLSHELRNPLAPIRNSIYLLERAPPGSPQAARAKDVIQRQTGHLTRLVDDLLDVTRISRGKIELQRERLDLREVVRRTCDDHRSLFESSRVDVRLDVPAGPVWIEADPTRVSQIVGNLLQNAAKFARIQGSVTVTVGADDGERALVRVRDDGVGMAPELVKSIFEPFVQAERSLARTQGGLGLGLALVRGLVELHGGTVWASSEGLGRGSEFVVALPFAPSARVRGFELREAQAAARSLVLIIEDNIDAGQTLAEVLELAGHRVHLAGDGTAGIAMARELRPDVVLCDIGLPDVSGYEIARTLRADDALRATRLIALTGYAQPEDKRRAAEAGFDAHIGKPAPLEEITAVVSKGG